MNEEARQQVTSRLGSARRLLVVAHARPDGDALGSMAALAAAARASGREARMLLAGEGGVPHRYGFLFPAESPAGAADFAALADAADLIVVVDTCAFAQLDGLEPALRARREKVVVVDHHATADDVGADRWIDTSAAAAGVMVGELIPALGWPLPAQAAEALLAAITSDTGWLRFSNTDGRALRAAAALVDSGVGVDSLYGRLFEADRPERIRLIARALASLEMHCADRVATMRLRLLDFDETGARPDETENLVNEAMRMGRVEVGILLSEAAEGQGDRPAGPPIVRVSLRSRGQVDVAAVARLFGGGGHTRAAGLRSALGMETLRHRLVAACAEALQDGGGQAGPGDSGGAPDTQHPAPNAQGGAGNASL